MYGGTTGPSLGYLHSLSKLARCRGWRDDTEYRDPPGKKRLSYVEHHARALSAAMVFGEAARLNSKPARMHARRGRARDGGAPSPPSAGPA